jgi:hypothetical protein
VKPFAANGVALGLCTLSLTGAVSFEEFAPDSINVTSVEATYTGGTFVAQSVGAYDPEFAQPSTPVKFPRMLPREWRSD